MCAIEASAGTGEGAVRLRARSRSADGRGGAFETSYCSMADGDDAGERGDGEPSEEEERPPTPSSDTSGSRGGDFEGEKAPAYRSRSQSRARSRSRAAARAVGKLLLHGRRRTDPDGGAAGRNASPEDEGGAAGPKGHSERGSSHHSHGSDAQSSATHTTENSNSSSRLYDFSSEDGEDDDGGNSVSTEESARGGDGRSSPEGSNREVFGESIVVCELERDLYGAGTGYDVDDYIPATVEEEEEEDGAGVKESSYVSTAGDRAIPTSDDEDKPHRAPQHRLGESFPDMVRRNSVEVLPGDSIDDIARKNELMVRMLHESSGGLGGSGEKRSRRRKGRRRGSADSESSAREPGEKRPAPDDHPASSPARDRLAADDGPAVVSPGAEPAGGADRVRDDGAIGTALLLEKFSEWDASGRCVRHRHVRLRKKKMLGKGWKVLMSGERCSALSCFRDSPLHFRSI